MKTKILKLRSDRPLHPVPHEEGKKRLRELYKIVQNMPEPKRRKP